MSTNSRRNEDINRVRGMTIRKETLLENRTYNQREKRRCKIRTDGSSSSFRGEKKKGEIKTSLHKLLNNYMIMTV